MVELKRKTKQKKTQRKTKKKQKKTTEKQKAKAGPLIPEKFLQNICT